jgi:hypothetical protein
MAWYIKTRAEFFEVLARTSALAQQRQHAAAQAQLQAMTDATANGRTPTDEERRQITIGHGAARALDEQQPAGGEAEYLECLVQLAGYFDEWPAED